MRTAAVLSGLALVLTAACSEGPSGDALPSDPPSEPSAAPQTAAPGWEPIAAAPLSARTGSVGGWTGTELIVVGGVSWQCSPNADCPGPDREDNLLDAAAYSPDTDTWRELPGVPAPVFHDLATWTGTDLVIVHHPRHYWREEVTTPGAVSAYDPAADAWRTLDPPPTQDLTGGVWTGERLVYWLGEDASGSVYTLDPVSGTWDHLPPDPLGATFDRSMAWVDGHLYLAGLAQDDQRKPKVFQVTSLDPSTDRWAAPREAPVTFWAQQWFAFDGHFVNASQDASRGYASDAARIDGALDPTTGEWTRVPQVGTHAELTDGCALPPVGAAGQWLAPGGPLLVSLNPPSVLTAPHCEPLTDPQVAAWTGAELIIWGGYAQTAQRNSSAGLTWTPPAP